jgi:peroxiredoxin Q/BCP
MMKRFLQVIGLIGWCCGGFLFADKPPVVGSEAPRMTVTIESGETLDLGELYKKGKLVVFFYPKAMTGGCTAQACSLRDAYQELTDAGIQVIGVSRDSVELQKQFKAKNRLPFSLIADVDGSVMRAFGVREAREGMSAREAFIVSEGRIIWHDNKASTDKQAADIKAALEKLKE